MSVQEKFDLVQALLREHNDAVGGEGKPGFVNPEAFISCVKAQGGTKEEYLKALKYEDIEQCLPAIQTPNGTIKATLLAKEIAKVFRGKEDTASTTTEEKRPVGNKKADRMTPRELVEAFDPEDFDSTVANRLKSMSQGKPFLVFKEGRLLDVEVTVKLLLEVKQGYPGRDVVDANGKIGVKVYKIGELPDNYADENPVFEDRPLRPDGTCCQTNRSWEGVSHSVRQFVRLIVNEGLVEANFNGAQAALDLAIQPDAMKKLRERYRKVAVEFDELEKTNNLPKLKVPLSSTKQGTNRPFNEGKRVVWVADPKVHNAYKSR